MALTHDGEVYSWGKNEEGQLGVGDTYTEFQKKKNQEYNDITMEEMKLEQEFKNAIKDAKEKDDKAEIKKLTATHKKSVKKFSQLKNAKEDVEGLLYFPIPQKIESLSGIIYIDSGKTYNYAIGTRKLESAEDSKMEESKVPEEKEAPKVDTRLNAVYSWGIGNSYVLATRDEETRYTPYSVPPEMYKNLNPVAISCGTLHVVVRADEQPEQPDKPQPEKKPENKVKEMDKLAEKVIEESGQNRKRKFDEMEQDPVPQGKILIMFHCLSHTL